jgi:hypothetical protein
MRYQKTVQQYREHNEGAWRTRYERGIGVKVFRPDGGSEIGARGRNVMVVHATNY